MLRDPDLFRARPPHGLGTRAYAADFNEVKAVGATVSGVRTPEQTAAANYWGLTNATATISSILRSVAIGQGGTLADHALVICSLGGPQKRQDGPGRRFSAVHNLCGQLT